MGEPQDALSDAIKDHCDKYRNEIQRLQAKLAEANEQQEANMAVCVALQRDNKQLTERVGVLEEVAKDVVEWNTKYPSSRIYNESRIREIAAEMDLIFEKAKKALEDSYAI